MKKKINILVADPAGNITIYVYDHFERSQYQAVATQLLEMKELNGEQVAFILDAPSCGRAQGKMDMCGLEFCGNASRTFGLLTAKAQGIQGKGVAHIDVSGCDEILSVEVDTDTNYTKIKMPNPIQVLYMDLSWIFEAEYGLELGTLVKPEDVKSVRAIDFGGIIHLILKDIPATAKTFDLLKDYVNETYNPPAMGVMFCNTQKQTLEPVVYVKDVDSTYFEGSCGSGTTACAVSFALGRQDGTYSFTIPQPAGTIGSTVEMEDGKVKAVYIEGPVGLSEILQVEVEI